MSRVLNIFVPHCSGLFTDHLPHGDGLVAHGFISRLGERGHNVHAAAEKVDLARPLPPNVRLYRIQSRVRGAGLGRADYMLQVRSLFRKLQSSVRFDLVHQLNPVYTGVSLALWDAGVPVVLGPYVADWPFDPHAISSNRNWVKPLLRYAKRTLAYLQQKRASALLLTTEAARERVIKSGRWSPPIHFLPHGLDSELFSPGPSQRRGQAGPRNGVILFYANVTERKGIFDLLRAFDIVSQRNASAELWIAGDGKELGAAKEMARTLRASSRVIFLGRQTQREAVQLFRDADIYCLPSYGEPYGMTVAEAMGCGLPVVVTDAGGARWLVDREGGLRVPVKSPEKLADALCELLLDEDRRAAMGHHNRMKVMSSFSWDKVMDRLEEIYEAALQLRQEEKPTADVLSPTSVEDYL